MDSGSSGCVVGELHWTQIVCTPRFRHVLDRQRICSVSLPGTEEQLSAPWQVGAFQGHRDVGREAILGVFFRHLLLPTAFPGWVLDWAGRQKNIKKTLHWVLWGTCEHRTSRLWEPSNSEDIRETLQHHVLQPLTHLGQGWVQWLCPLSYGQ